jgi:hypothetical protein
MINHPRMNTCQNACTHINDMIYSGKKLVHTEVNAEVNNMNCDSFIAGSIIRTAEHFLTHNTFVSGLRNYLGQK